MGHFKQPFNKGYRKRFYFMIFIGLCASIMEGYQIGYISILYIFPLSVIVVYFGFLVGDYINKRFDKKV